MQKLLIIQASKLYQYGGETSEKGKSGDEKDQSESGSGSCSICSEDFERNDVIREPVCGVSSPSNYLNN